MINRFKTEIPGFESLFEAARKRVSDEAYSDLKRPELDERAVAFLQSGGGNSRSPALTPGSRISSTAFRTDLKDTKFMLNILNSRSSVMEELIRSTTKESFGTLRDIEQEALAMSSMIAEQEFKILGGHTTVHYNAFTRPIDVQVPYRDKLWLVDYKTRLPFLEENLASVLPNTGITLPIKQQVTIPIVNAILVGEETDVGDTRKPILSNSPRNVFLPNKTFRHVIARTEFDKTTRKYDRGSSFCTLLLELANIQLVNHMLVKPLGNSVVEIAELSYLNEGGESISLSTMDIDVGTSTLLLFEPVRTRYLQIKFKQSAPVSKTMVKLSNQRIKEINSILLGAGFTQHLNNPEEEIQGRVFDFSIEEIQVGLTIYNGLGIFRSLPVKVNSPYGFTATSVVEAIGGLNTRTLFSRHLTLPDDMVLQEMYIGVSLQDEQNQNVVHELVPIPDSSTVQVEYLALTSKESRLKLMPDLQAGVEDSLFVYCDNTLLILGTDYEVSIDGGRTYHTELPHAEEFRYLFKRARAGNFYVRLFKCSRDSIYWTQYKVLKNQILSSSGIDIILRNGRVVFSTKALGTHGTLQAVIIQRASSSNHYLTAVTRSYVLKVKERVS